MKASIELPLKKEIYAAYLRFLFNAKKGDHIELSRREDLGAYIFSRIRKCELPVLQNKPEGYQVITLDLPENRYTSFDRHFIYFTREDIEQINDYIKADYSLFIRQMMVMGRDLGIRQKQLIEAIISGCKFEFDGKKFDMIKKKDYRYREKLFAYLSQGLKEIGIKDITKHNTDLSPTG